MSFIPSYTERGPKRDDDYAFIFCGGEILVRGSAAAEVSDANELAGGLSSPKAETETGRLLRDGIYFGSLDGRGCYAYSIDRDGASSAGYPGGLEPASLRSRLSVFDEGVWEAASLAAHLTGWSDRSRYCGRCGAQLRKMEREMAKECAECGNVVFPRISPAVIVAVRKGDRILLAHNRNFPEGRYSLLAGFMEMGETIEETAAREVKEEAGIEIENIRYLASQSWPFPDSLMIGLTADYKSGELVPDGEEITDAGWYSPDSFPSIPGEGTIARKIIDRCTKEYSS